MQILNPKFAHYESQVQCFRTDIVFFPVSEISDGTVSLVINVLFLIGVKVLLVSTQRCNDSTKRIFLDLFLLPKNITFIKNI